MTSTKKTKKKGGGEGGGKGKKWKTKSENFALCKLYILIFGYYVLEVKPLKKWKKNRVGSKP